MRYVERVTDIHIKGGRYSDTAFWIKIIIRNGYAIQCADKDLGFRIVKLRKV